MASKNSIENFESNAILTGTKVNFVTNKSKGKLTVLASNKVEDRSESFAVTEIKEETKLGTRN